jgi:hypothetical protein
MKETIHTTLRIPAWLMQKLRAYAAEHKISLKAALLQLLGRALSPSPEKLLEGRSLPDLKTGDE